MGIMERVGDWRIPQYQNCKGDIKTEGTLEITVQKGGLADFVKKLK